MSRYEAKAPGFFRFTKKGSDQLTNFICQIDEELIYHDATKKTTNLKISGKLYGPGDPTDLPSITLPATDFKSMSWIPEQWGLGPIIYPVESAERDLAAAIQINSKPIKKDIYTHTGWTTLNNEPAYLSMSGAITRAGLNTGITVSLPTELTRYRLPEPNDLGNLIGQQAAKDAWTASIRLVNIGPKEILWPLLIATYRAAIAAADFGLHVTGKTGTFKSEIASLFQSHYGEGMDARHLPCSWSSTENANEALLYRAKDAICVIDDFVPQGSSYQVKGLQAKADRLIRGQGNQAGRARLTDVSSLQQTMYPRGIILSTGEDTPDGHSVRARMLIMELDPGSIPPARLSTAQDARHLYPQAMADWIHYLTRTNAADVLQQKRKARRDELLGTGHSRTPPILGDLLAAAELLFQYARDSNYYPGEKCTELLNMAEQAIIAQGNQQLGYLMEADPVDAIFEAIKRMLGTNTAHVRTRNGGIPQDAEQLGFIRTSQEGEADSLVSHGPTLGWVDYQQGEFLLDPNHLTQIKKVAGVSVSEPTLIKRIKESGALTRTDDTRHSIKIRVTAGGATRNVLACNIDRILDNQAAAT